MSAPWSAAAEQGGDTTLHTRPRHRFTLPSPFAQLRVTGLLTLLFSLTGTAASLPKIAVSADQRSFQTSDGRRFVPFGVTYYRPGTGWAPQVWKQFDAEATRADFARMKAARVNCVRVFLSYGSFYREPGVLDTNGLPKFDQFLALAEEQGIYVHPTGPDHWEGTPAWAAADRIADDKVLAALEQFWTLFAARYRDRNVIFAYDLRNEPEVSWSNMVMRARWSRWVAQKYGDAAKASAAWHIPVADLQTAPIPATVDAPGNPLLLDYQEFRENLADEWTRRQSAAIKAADSKALVTVGMIQWSVPSLLPRVSSYAAFNPLRQAPFLDFLEIHFYPLNAGAMEYQSRAEIERNLSYLDTVVAAVARAGKPVVVAEFGWYGGGKPRFDRGRHPFATEEQQADWCSNLVARTSSMACGWLNWGFYDQPEASDCSQFTGLYTDDGREKAWGRTFRELQRRTEAQDLKPMNRRTSAPVLSHEMAITSARAGNEFREGYYQWYRTNFVSSYE